MIVSSHLKFTSRGIDFHSFQRKSDINGFEGFRFLNCSAKHFDHGIDILIIEVHTILFLELEGKFGCFIISIIIINMPRCNLKSALTSILEVSRCSSYPGIERCPFDFQACIVRSFN